MNALEPNLISRPYRGLSVQDVGFDLTHAALRRWIVGRDVYRRSEFVLARHGEQAALLALDKAPSNGLFAPVIRMRMLAGPAEVLVLDRPDVDVGNPSALAEVAGAHRLPGKRAYVVTGRYRHVNFILDPTPTTLYVDEVVPPHPAKLVDMVDQVVRFDEDLPPIRIVSRLISLPMLIRRGGDSHLLPCRGAGAPAAAGHDYLDAGPNVDPTWTLIGCERSRQIYRHHYGAEPSAISFCPAAFSGPAPRITKCCLLERGMRVSQGVATVPWGANLDEVRAAAVALLDPARSAGAEGAAGTNR